MSDKGHSEWSLCVFLCVVVMSIAACTAYSAGAVNPCGKVAAFSPQHHPANEGGKT